MLKSYANGGVQVVVNGLVYKNQPIGAYFDELDELKIDVEKAFSQLLTEYDLVIAEGAGSPVELNLLHKDLSNTFIAQTFNSKVILVADIERGGVFASIYGTLALLTPQIRQNVIGVIINKFRGDRRFFDEGEKIIEQQFHVPVLGVLPFLPLNIDMEDSQSLHNYCQRRANVKIKIAIIATPKLSNYNDFDVLMADDELDVTLIHDFQTLDYFDVILLAGSKSVLSDLRWLKSNGLFAQIQQFEKAIFGICGGYQMLCEKLDDPFALESEIPSCETGFGFIDDSVTYKEPKILHLGDYKLFDFDVKGYEIHCGRLEKYPLFYQSERICGTHVHGIFDNNAFRTAYFKKLNSHYHGFDYPFYRENTIETFTNMIKDNVNIDLILQALKTDV